MNNNHNPVRYNPYTMTFLRQYVTVRQLQLGHQIRRGAGMKGCVWYYTECIEAVLKIAHTLRRGFGRLIRSAFICRFSFEHKVIKKNPYPKIGTCTIFDANRRSGTPWRNATPYCSVLSLKRRRMRRSSIPREGNSKPRQVYIKHDVKAMRQLFLVYPLFSTSLCLCLSICLHTCMPVCLSVPVDLSRSRSLSSAPCRLLARSLTLSLSAALPSARSHYIDKL